MLPETLCYVRDLSTRHHLPFRQRYCVIGNRSRLRVVAVEEDSRVDSLVHDDECELQRVFRVVLSLQIIQQILDVIQLDLMNVLDLTIANSVTIEEQLIGQDTVSLHVAFNCIAERLAEIR